MSLCLVLNEGCHDPVCTKYMDVFELLFESYFPNILRLIVYLTTIILGSYAPYLHFPSVGLSCYFGYLVMYNKCVPYCKIITQQRKDTIVMSHQERLSRVTIQTQKDTSRSDLVLADPKKKTHPRTTVMASKEKANTITTNPQWLQNSHDQENGSHRLLRRVQHSYVQTREGYQQQWPTRRGIIQS